MKLALGIGLKHEELRSLLIMPKREEKNDQNELNSTLRSSALKESSPPNHQKQRAKSEPDSLIQHALR